MLLYAIDDDYINYLSKVDSRVMHNKERPYAGVVCQINNLNWYVPLTSHKEEANLKPSFIWLHAIYDSANSDKITAYLFFRNMIPAPDSAVDLFNFDLKGTDTQGVRYKDLLNKQHIFIKRESQKIQKNAKNFHSLLVGRKLGSAMENRACDFNKLEIASRVYRLGQKA